MKCCDHSLDAALQGLNGPMVIGMEIVCTQCDSYWRYEQKRAAQMWIRREGARTNAFVTREGTPEATAQRESAYTRILGREREK